MPPKADEYEWVWKVRFSCGSERSCGVLSDEYNPSAGARDIEVYNFFCELCSNRSVHATEPREMILGSIEFALFSLV